MIRKSMNFVIEWWERVKRMLFFDILHKKYEKFVLKRNDKISIEWWGMIFERLVIGTSKFIE